MFCGFNKSKVPYVRAGRYRTGVQYMGNEDNLHVP